MHAHHYYNYFCNTFQVYVNLYSYYYFKVLVIIVIAITIPNSDVQNLKWYSVTLGRPVISSHGMLEWRLGGD